MSLFDDYSHQILHHQTERELIQQNRQDRLAREARGVDAVLPVVAPAGPSRTAPLDVRRVADARAPALCALNGTCAMRTERR